MHYQGIKIRGGSRQSEGYVSYFQNESSGYLQLTEYIM